MQTLAKLATPSTFPFTVVMFEDNSPNFADKNGRFYLEQQQNVRAIRQLLERSGLVERPLPGAKTSWNRLFVRTSLDDVRPTGVRLESAKRAAEYLLRDGAAPYNVSRFLLKDPKRVASLLAQGLPDAVESVRRHEREAMTAPSP